MYVAWITYEIYSYLSCSISSTSPQYIYNISERICDRLQLFASTCNYLSLYGYLYLTIICTRLLFAHLNLLQSTVCISCIILDASYCLQYLYLYTDCLHLLHHRRSHYWYASYCLPIHCYLNLLHHNLIYVIELICYLHCWLDVNCISLSLYLYSDCDDTVGPNLTL